MRFGDIVESKNTPAEFAEKIGTEGDDGPERKLQQDVSDMNQCMQLYTWVETYYRDDVVLNRCWERRKPEERYHVNLHRKHQSTAHL